MLSLTVHTKSPTGNFKFFSVKVPNWKKLHEREMAHGIGNT